MKAAEPLAELAKHIAKKALDKDTPFAEALDAFGKLTSYHALVLKHQGKIAPDEGDSPTMDKFARELREESVNGRTSSTIQAGRRDT